ncbi:glycosyltransferase [Pelagibacteraceae bacterium]|nr:glycosyltransferase [Pelagibacteraceae bacterium]
MKKNFLLITGGTGGHVIPAKNFANYLSIKNINCTIITDKRGYKYFDNYSGKIYVISSSNLNGNIILKIYGIFQILLGLIQSFIIIFLLKPSHSISFGSYASFSPMLSCMVFKPFYKVKLYIHEQNSIIGRTNKFFLNFTNKLFLNFDIKSKINSKFKDKIFVVGSPENSFKKNFNISNINSESNFTIFISGGSQGSEFVSNFATNLIKIIDNEKIIRAKFIFQCSKNLIKKQKEKLRNIKSPIILKDFFINIDEILANANLAICRAGAGTIVDLINFKLPSILIPLPSSKDNHQFFNAKILAKHDLAIIIDQNNDDLDRAKRHIYETYNNAKKLQSMNKKFDMIKVKNSNTLIYKLIINEN